MSKSWKSMIARMELNGINPSKQAEAKSILKYNNTLDGYVRSTSSNLIKMIIGDAKDYFKYLAGERTHIYNEFDELKHEIVIQNRSPELMIDHGIPFGIYDMSANSTEEIPPGLYKMQDSDQGLYLKKMTISSDKYIDFRQDKKYDIYSDLIKFKNDKAKYEKEGVRHKNAVLLFGPHGCGKTRNIVKILENASKDDIICVFITSDVYSLTAIENFKYALKDKFVVFIIEEITERANDKVSVEELLSFLDGETSWNNCYVIATTNHPENLPANVIDRPGRFGKLIEFGPPNELERKMYLEARGVSEPDLSEAVELSKDLSVDYLVQSVTQSKLNNISVVEYLNNSKKTKELIANSFKKSKLGLMD